MRCPRCQADNREGRRFCGLCGLSLRITCEGCGFENQPSDRFCGGCGRGLPGESFEGTVRLINVSADSATRTFMTRISVPNPKHKLRIGMVAEVRISGDKIVQRLTVPIETIVRDPQGATTVLVYYPDQNRAHVRRVEVGAVFGRDIEIRKGLTGDESVILAGQERLREGDVVSVASAGDQEDRTVIAKKETSK